MAHIALEDRDGIALVRIDRAPANAMDPELLAEGIAVAERLEAAPPRAVVLTGRDGFFSAGLDLKAVPTLGPDERERMMTAVNSLFRAWYGLPAAVVCAVNGHAIAGGMILALCGDYRVGGGTGRIGLTELSVGVPYPEMAMRVVRAELTPAVARRLVLGSELLDLATGVELGFLDEWADEPVSRALEVAERYAAHPAPGYGAIKRHLRAPVLHNPA
jgi:enoyl-CoA hydratase